MDLMIILKVKVYYLLKHESKDVQGIYSDLDYSLLLKTSYQNHSKDLQELNSEASRSYFKIVGIHFQEERWSDIKMSTP